MEPISPELLQELRAGRTTRERKIAVCSGGLHLAPADRAEILVVLVSDPDEMIAQRAADALLSVPLEAFLEAVQRENALPALFSYCTHNLADKPGVADALARNPHCGADHLIPVARFLTSSGIQSLMDELDRVSSSHALAAALEHSAAASLEHKHLLHELRGTSHDSAAIEEAAAIAEPDPVRRQTLIQRLATMNVSQKVQLALKGGSEERRTLIRDANKVVQRAVLASPRLSEREVEAFSAMPNLTDEILRSIANNRNFRKNYAVVRNLMNNPKTPLDVSLHMLPLLNPMDLKLLTTNKNIPETLRTTAYKLVRQRKEARENR